MNPTAVVLVEGTSDQVALETLAERRGRDLAAEAVAIVAIGGAKNIANVLDQYGPRGLDVALAGLVDAAEADDYRRALERAGVDAGRFFVCDVDLEDELLRAVGVERVEAILIAEGEMGAFRTFQKQAAQQPKTTHEQLRRFMGTRGGRKIRYARLLVDALDLSDVPVPLDAVLGCVGRPGSAAGEDLGGRPLT